MEKRELEQQINKLTSLLSNDAFRKKAPKVVIEKEEERLRMFQVELEKGVRYLSPNGNELFTDGEVREMFTQIIRAYNN